MSEKKEKIFNLDTEFAKFSTIQIDENLSASGALLPCLHQSPAPGPHLRA